MITATHESWCTEHLDDICRSDEIETGPVGIRIVGAANWDDTVIYAGEPSLVVEANGNEPLTPGYARLLAVRLVQLADQIDRAAD